MTEQAPADKMWLITPLPRSAVSPLSLGRRGFIVVLRVARQINSGEEK
jgi:hypothetical protein